MQRCVRCGGTKKIAPMGGIQIECTVCKGVGMIRTESLQSGISLSGDAIINIDGITHSAGETTLPFNCQSTNQPLSKGEFHTISEISENTAKIEQPLTFNAIEIDTNTNLDGTVLKVRNKPGRKPGWNKVINPV